MCHVWPWLKPKLSKVQMELWWPFFGQLANWAGRCDWCFKTPKNANFLADADCMLDTIKSVYKNEISWVSESIWFLWLWSDQSWIIHFVELSAFEPAFHVIFCGWVAPVLKWSSKTASASFTIVAVQLLDLPCHKQSLIYYITSWWWMYVLMRDLISYFALQSVFTS